MGALFGGTGGFIFCSTTFSLLIVPVSFLEDWMGIPRSYMQKKQKHAHIDYNNTVLVSSTIVSSKQCTLG